MPGNAGDNLANSRTITYGDSLSDTQLNAIANTAGSFVYNLPAGTILHPGTQSLSLTFTPTDSTDYAATTADVSLVVAQATPRLSGRLPRQSPTATL